MTPRRRELLLTAALALLCLALGAVLSQRLTGMDPRERMRAALVERGSNPAAASASIEAAPSGIDAPATDDAVIVERPLFAPGRRPSPAAEQPLEVPVPLSPPSLVLRGVVHSAGTRKVIVESTADLRLTRLREGESIDGWEVAAILPKKVVLRQGSTTIEVPLPRDRALLP